MYVQLYAELYYGIMLIGWLVFHLGTVITSLLGWTYNVFQPSYNPSNLIHQGASVIADFTTLGESHIVWPSPVPLQTHYSLWTILLSFDVSLTIPKNIRKMIYAAFSLITAYIHGYSLYSHVHRDVCIIQNYWTVPCLESDSYDSWPSICLEIAQIRPFSIPWKSYIRNP